MRSGSRKNRPSRAFTLLLLLGAVAFAAGCSSSQSPGGSGANVNHILPSGSSVAGWLAVPSGGSHARTATLDYIAGGGNSGCTQCHGSDLSGGISRVSCFGNPAGCHHDPVANWASPAVHGATAKQAPGSSGFASCQICHGNNFAGTSAAPSCLNNAGCHGATVASPHASQWRTGDTYVHTTTAEGNAAVCGLCHLNGANSPVAPPSPPAPAGTAPGCYNNTLCHGENPVPHITGSTWLNPGTGFHGTDAKSDLTGCQVCHGTPGTINFNGGSAPTACSACHTASTAHPTDWQGLRTINGVTITHRTSGNRDVACAICHNTTGPGAGPNPSAPSCFSASFTNAAGQARACHPGGPGSAPHALGGTWVIPTVGGSAFHGTTAKADLLFCQECHGTPPRGFNGGTGATTACTTCHSTAEAHPTDWQGVRTISTASITHRTSGNRDAACGICHNVTAPGTGPNPAAPSCFSASHTNGGGQTRPCHPGGPAAASHLIPFDNTAHYSVNNTTFTANCGSCHAVTGASPVSGAPLCTTCHAAGSPLTALSCTSCHANPPNGGAGAAYANIAGAHATHITLNGTGSPVTCDTCHNGLGSGTLNHYNRAKARVPPGDAAFPATYNAETGASSFDNSAALSCSNVSCHGGQATPNWQTGTLNVNTQCTSCHSQGTAQFNSYNSGDHGINASHSNCTNCHNTTALAANHFTNLSTPAMEGPASATIGGTGTLIPAGNYNAGSCTPSCHGNETW